MLPLFYCQNVSLAGRAGINGKQEENDKQGATPFVMDGKQVGKESSGRAVLEC